VKDILICSPNLETNPLITLNYSIRI